MMKKTFFTALILGLLAFGCGPEGPELPNESDTPDIENTDPDTPGNEDPEQPVEPQEAYYVKVAENFSDWSGDYLITYTTSSSIKVFDSFSGSDKGGSGTDLYQKLTADGIHSSDRILCRKSP